MPAPGPNPQLERKLWSRMTIYLVIVAALLFGGAGTLAWPAAWVYLALMAAISIGGGLWLVIVAASSAAATIAATNVCGVVITVLDS